MQTTQNQIDVHKYPSGKQVIKAFTPSDWIIYNKSNVIISKTNIADQSTSLQKVKVTFQIQKNRENGQSITLKADNKALKYALSEQYAGYYSKPNDLAKTTTNH